MKLASYNAERILLVVVVTAWCGVAFGGVSAAWAIARSLTTAERLLLHEVHLEGNEALSRQDVLERAGLDSVRTVLSLDLDRIEAELLEDPWIAGAEVELQRANALAIRLSERRAVAVAATPEPYLVADDGTLLVPVRGGLPDMPFITGVVGGPEDDLNVDGGALMDALHFVELWQATSHEDAVVEVGYDVVDGLRVLFASGLLVRLDASELNAAIERLLLVREEIVREEVAVVSVDLRFGDEAVVELAPESEAPAAPNEEAAEQEDE